VVNQEIAGLTTETPSGPKAGAKAAPKPAKHAALDPSVAANPVTLFSGGNTPPQRLRYDSMVPKNIKDTFHDWQTEILGSGVHVHSKVIVLDPFGANPVVMTGSHNLGYKASHENDDNLMIVQGNAPLAAAYAANIIAIYQSYRWNAYVEAHRQDPQVWHGLVDSDKWQDSYLAEDSDDLKEILFWLGQHAAAGAPPAPPPPPGPAVDGTRARAVTATGPAPGSVRPPHKTRGKGAKEAANRKKATKNALPKKRAPSKRKAASAKQKSTRRR
jgi:hypothetical protein